MTSDSHIQQEDLGGFMPRFAGVFFASAVVATLGVGPVRSVMEEWALGQSATPYFLPQQAVALYLLVPAITLASAFLFLAPGLILAAVFGRAKSLPFWLLAGLGNSLLVVTAVVSLVQLVTGVVPAGQGFVWLVAALGLGCLVIAGFRLSSGAGLRVAPSGWGVDLGVSVALCWAVLVLMAPKFYWENFSGDGSGSLQFTRLFVHTLWPFWPKEAGVISQAPGLTSFLFVIPDSWFVRLWGELEYSVRAPYVLGLGLLYPVLTALIRTGRPDARLTPVDHLLLAAALVLYSVSIIYSGGYHAWFGDSPMPAVRETLAMFAFMAYILAFIEDRRALMLVAGVMAHLSIPTGGLWLLLWPLAVLLTWRPIPWPRLRFAALVLVVAAAISIGLPVVIGLFHLPFPGNEFSAHAILQRLRFVSVIDWARFGYLAIPMGFVPALALLAWKWQDSVSRALTMLTLLFFAFFYLQGYRVLLHHFIPAMVPPLVVLWRLPLMRAVAGRVVVALGLVAGLWCAAPRDWGVHGHDRAFAAFIQTEGPRFSGTPRGQGEVFRGFDPKALDTFHHLFGDLLPIGYGETEAGERFFGAPLVWFYYSEFPKSPDQVINYVLKPVADATPDDGTLQEEYDGYGLYVRDRALFDMQRAQRLPIDTGAWALRTPRDIIFGSGAKWSSDWGGRKIIDLVPIAKHILGMKDKPGAAAQDAPSDGQ